MLRRHCIEPAIPALLIAAALVAAMPAHAQLRKPVPSTDQQQELINEGNVLHDNQDFDGAIGRYNEVLRLNPDNVDALFELATCYYDKGEHQQSLDAALRGAAYESDNLGYLYILIGTNYDELKQPQKAEQAYREGIKAEPESYLLHYNLAITDLGLKKVNDARESLKRALTLNPNHASSNIGLGQIYLASGYRIPALLAFCRALVLEPASGRAESTMHTLQELLGDPAPASPDVEHVEPPKSNGRSDEGNFASSEKLLNAITVAVNADNEISEMNLLVQRLRRVFAQIDPARTDGGFASEYYAPYFAELVKRGYLEPMAYHIFQSAPKEGLADWLRLHDASVKAFLAWSKGYVWKKKKS